MMTWHILNNQNGSVLASTANPDRAFDALWDITVPIAYKQETRQVFPSINSKAIRLMARLSIVSDSSPLEFYGFRNVSTPFYVDGADPNGSVEYFVMRGAESWIFSSLTKLAKLAQNFPPDELANLNIYQIPGPALRFLVRRR